jgi:uncharacterized protein YgbK (DUF1537 family)
VNDEIADRSGPDADRPVDPGRMGNAAAGELPLADTGRRIAVLDDDPTGSQTVHNVDVVTVFEPDEIAAGLSPPGATCFILTNTRSLPEADAVELNTRIGRILFELAARLDAPIDVVSRSDSTLRGHVIAEVRALDAVRREVTGRGFDGVLMVPAYFEAGRFTAGNVHWARVGADVLPASETEFARDATFGYAASDLREFVAEKSGGMVGPGDVLSITHDDIRLGGPHRVAEILAGVNGGAFVVVNAVKYADLDVVVLGLLDAEAAGKSFLHRSGPSFVQSLAGLDPRDPLRASDIWPAGHPSGHGLVVVGSHVGLTSRQVAVAQQYGGLAEVELDVAAIADSARRDSHVAEVTRCCCSPAVRCFAAGTPPKAWRSRDGFLPPSPGWSASRLRPSPRGSSPRAASRRTTWPSAVSASGAPRYSASCSPDWYRSSAPSTPRPRSSAHRTSCSPATSATNRPWRRSSTCSAGGPDARWWNGTTERISDDAGGLGRPGSDGLAHGP